MSDHRNQLPYDVQRALLAAWDASGRISFVRRNRNGDIRISLNGMAATPVGPAMTRIEKFLENNPEAVKTALEYKS